MVTYAYMRVSTKEQNLERQYQAIKEFRPDLPETNIFSDKQTGKDFNREQYQAMKIILEHVKKTKEEVEVVIKEVDRLGRNADAIKKELQWFKDMGIVVRILEIPSTLGDVSEENKLVFNMVNSILIEVYTVLAEQEMRKREQRQAEGIRAAKERGVRFGRTPIEVNELRFKEIYKAWKEGRITARKAMEILELKPNTFYRRVQKFENKNDIEYI